MPACSESSRLFGAVELSVLERVGERNDLRVLALMMLASACATPERNGTPSVPVTPPADLCGDPTMGEGSFCLDEARIERLLERDDYAVVDVAGPGRSSNDVKVLTFEVWDQGQEVRFRAKWKSAPGDGDAFNNSPRKELAAYELQKVFLAPDEYVVPPTTIRCVPLTRFRSEYQAPDAKPTFPWTDCVLGILTYWVEGVTDKHILHAHRFERDPRYRRAISQLNLLTYLIDHRDSHDGNFLISTDPRRPRAFSIDNGLAFSGLRNPLPILEGLPNWSHIVVPALPADKLATLRHVTRAQLAPLGTVAQLVLENGVLVKSERERPFDPHEGVRIRAGTVQLGLDQSEIDGIESRIHELVERADQREIAVFSDARSSVSRGS